MPTTSLPLALAAVRGGTVSRAELLRAGLHGDLGDRLVREGAWTRLAPSTYLTSRRPPTDGQLVAAARAHVGSHLVVTGLVACRALGLRDVPRGGPVEVLVPPGTRSVSTAYVLVRQSARVCGTWTRGGVRYALAVRAVADGARRLPELQAVRALVLAAVADGACGADELAAECDAGARRGSALLRRAVQDARAGAWSAPEAEAADLVRTGGLPPFLLNPLVTVDGVPVGRPDGWFPGTSVGWQVDSRRHHSSDADFDATLAVHDRFAQHGLTLLHVTPRRLRTEGLAWVHSLAGALATCRPAPRDLVVIPGGPLQTRRRRTAA